MAEEAVEAVFDVKKNHGAVIRVQKTHFHEWDLVDIRVWTKNKAGEFKATKQGLNMRVGRLAAFMEAMRKVQEAVGEVEPLD